MQMAVNVALNGHKLLMGMLPVNVALVGCILSTVSSHRIMLNAVNSNEYIIDTAFNKQSPSLSPCLLCNPLF
jgi:hypothetical protein